MDYVVKLEDVKPRETPESMGHYGGKAWDIFTKDTINPEALRLLVQGYAAGTYTEGHPIHTDREQAYYVLSGTMTLRMLGREFTARAGSFVFIPRGVEHNHRNDGPDELRFITINAPVRSGDHPPLRKWE